MHLIKIIYNNNNTYYIFKVFMKIGLTQAEVDDYFTGPAFLAWFESFNNS